MLTFARRATRWVGAHALPATAAAVVLLGAAGGGIGYEVAGNHAASPVTKPPAAAPTPGAAAPRPGAASTAPARAAQLLQRGLEMLAGQTGQTTAQVRTQLMAGKSVNDIAGSGAAQVQATIITAITALADKAVAAGRITAGQEAAGLDTAKTRISALMAEPGPQLLKDLQQLIQFLRSHPQGGAVPAVGATPAA